jgi:hypothetical protein
MTVSDRIADKLCNMRCSGHGEFAKVTAEGQDFTRLE